ncbi:ATP-binding protein [Methylobacterium sp. Leaf108]|uniref:ATP-binding protein n=1 Tax=Methylobacterium sp. Leaf108 TaxID=1736256 RepID=UPI0006F6EECA|nr:ATP-binding protein [Methylobacterium sp. Leaf108]KQP61613.1 histidine kinase [Methylobacterium sp. Leaf108]
MKRVFGSIEGLTSLILLVTILVVQAGAFALYRGSAIAAEDDAFAGRTAAQLVLARDALMRRPVTERTAEARALSKPHFEIGWAEAATARPEGRAGPLLWTWVGRLVAFDPSLADAQLRLSLSQHDDAAGATDLHGEMRLPDGSFLTFQSAHAPALVRIGDWALLSVVMALVVSGAAILVVHRIAAPLRRLAQATDAIGRGLPVRVEETGPDETRRIGAALNAMQDRVQRVLADRTQALGAVSHDLRTPITRLRLRAEALHDAEDREAMTQDLADMEAMVASTLSYLRNEADPERPRLVDVVAIVLTLIDAAVDEGHDVAFEGPRRSLITARPLAIKRAIANLLDNAVKYGAGGTVRLRETEGTLAIAIHDRGPGIPPDDVERVFQAFERLETSRNRRSGGSGLGLTIAKTLIEAEGGSIDLTNATDGGLVARIVLPRATEGLGGPNP